VTTYIEPTRTFRNILVVDDVRTMKFEATTVRTLDEALTAIQSQPWDEVWLDHDLDFAAYDEAEADQWYKAGQDTTRPIARLAADLAEAGTPLDVKMFVLHTGNPAGKHLLANLLLPYYNVGITQATKWTKRETYPQWAQDKFVYDED
jgi:hypothetical protein